MVAHKLEAPSGPECPRSGLTRRRTIKAATVRQEHRGSIHVDALGTVTPISTVSVYEARSPETWSSRRQLLCEGQMVRKEPVA